MRHSISPGRMFVVGHVFQKPGARVPASSASRHRVTAFTFCFTVLVLPEALRLFGRSFFVLLFFHSHQLLWFSHDESPGAQPFPEHARPIGP